MIPSAFKLIKIQFFDEKSIKVNFHNTKLSSTGLLEESYRGVTQVLKKVLQMCNRSVTDVFHGCNRVVTGLLQSCSLGVTEVVQKCDRVFTDMLQGWAHGIYVLQGCYRGSKRACKTFEHTREGS